ncbi:hypothetical protein HDU83_001967 [Entophlyctis luteolus]|nr:hypothetical protein HDU83_001967 [Entophlyctis luteolus]
MSIGIGIGSGSIGMAASMAADMVAAGARADSPAAAKSCALCRTSHTPLWRKGPAPHFAVLCNSCCLRWKRYGDAVLAPAADVPPVQSLAPKRAVTKNLSNVQYPSGLAPPPMSTNPPVTCLPQIPFTHEVHIDDGGMGAEASPGPASAQSVRKTPQMTKQKAQSTSKKKLKKKTTTKKSAASKQNPKSRKVKDDDKGYGSDHLEEHDEVYEDPNKIYCYCRKPYDPELFYIQCDGCDEWYHGICANMSEEQADRIFLWFCRICERDSGRKPVFKKFCAAWLAGEEARLLFGQDNAGESDHGSTSPDLDNSESPSPNAMVPKSEYSTSPFDESTDVAANECNNYTEVIPETPLSPLPESARLFSTPKTCLKYLPDPVNPSIAALQSKTRNSTDSPISSPFSRYCSDTCGFAISRHALQCSISNGEIFARRKKAVPNCQINDETHVLEAFDKLDVQSLHAILDSRDKTRSRIKLVRDALWRVELAIWRADVVNHFARECMRTAATCAAVSSEQECQPDDKENSNNLPEISNHCAPKARTTKKKRKGTVPGQDSRAVKTGKCLCAFDASTLECLETSLDPTKSGLYEIDGASTDTDDDEHDLCGFDFDTLERASCLEQIRDAVPLTMCTELEDVCEKHNNWRSLKVEELKLELALLLHPYSAMRLRMFATAPTTTVPAVAPLLDAHYGLRDEIAPAGRAAIDAFKPVAEELNARLLEKCAESVRYIDETNLRNYLSSRSPLFISSNWWFELKDHPKHPRDLIGKPPPDGVTSSFQIERAARFIVSILKFKANASGPAKRIFGSARVPGDVVDSFSMSPDSRHIVAMIKDHVFKVDVYDDDGNIAGVNEIERNNTTAKIARLLYAACAKSLEVSPSPSVGLLTTASRSVWAASHSHLAALSAANAENLQIIENALFSVHLDDKSTISNHNYSHLQFLHNKTGRNRWFDKTLQLIIASSGRTGLNCQVAEVGVSPFANLAETLVASESPIKRSSTSGAPMLPEPIKLEWTVDGDVKGAIASAVKKVATEIKSTESVLALYDILGERYIKEVAKSEVDAFLQVAFQLTWWRLHKSAPTAAMVVERPETGGVVTRSIVNEHVSAFVESFDNDDVLYDDKRAHFRAAINAIEQTLAGASPVEEPAAVGHVQALYSLADDGQKRAMEDALGPGVAYARSYALDTVRVRAAAPVSADNAEVFNAATSGGFYAGFANSDAFGYGVAYSVGMDDLKVAVSCKRSSKGGPNAHRFTDGFKSVLADLLILFPKRTEVWGYDWKEKLARKQKEEHYLKTMRMLSDKYFAQKDALAKKYNPKKTAELKK